MTSVLSVQTTLQPFAQLSQEKQLGTPLLEKESSLQLSCIYFDSYRGALCL